MASYKIRLVGRALREIRLRREAHLRSMDTTKVTLDEATRKLQEEQDLVDLKETESPSPSSFDDEKELPPTGPTDVYINSVKGIVFDEKNTPSPYPEHDTVSSFASEEHRRLYEEHTHGYFYAFIRQLLRQIGHLWRQFHRTCCLPDLFNTRPTLHMFHIHPVTGRVEIAGDVENFDHQKYKIVTTSVKFPSALECGYGVVAVEPHRWWKRQGSKNEAPIPESGEGPAMPFTKKQTHPEIPAQPSKGGPIYMAVNCTFVPANQVSESHRHQTREGCAGVAAGC